MIQTKPNLKIKTPNRTPVPAAIQISDGAGPGMTPRREVAQARDMTHWFMKVGQTRGSWCLQKHGKWEWFVFWRAWEQGMLLDGRTWLPWPGPLQAPGMTSQPLLSWCPAGGAPEFLDLFSNEPIGWKLWDWGKDQAKRSHADWIPPHLSGVKAERNQCWHCILYLRHGHKWQVEQRWGVHGYLSGQEKNGGAGCENRPLMSNCNIFLLVKIGNIGRGWSSWAGT